MIYDIMIQNNDSCEHFYNLTFFSGIPFFRELITSL